MGDLYGAPGWPCCCCTAINYNWCAPDGLCPYDVPPMTDDWWKIAWRVAEGDWSCQLTGLTTSCPIALFESTGIGALVSNIPLSRNHYGSIGLASDPADAVHVGDMFALILGFRELSGNYNWIEINYEVTAATRARLQLVEYSIPNSSKVSEADSGTVIDECEGEIYLPATRGHVGSASGCSMQRSSGGNLVVGTAGEGLGQVVGETAAVGGLIGVRHRRVEANRWMGRMHYALIGNELDGPELEDVVCGYCVSCACGEDLVKKMPLVWNATLLLEGENFLDSETPFDCADEIFKECWHGQTFEMTPLSCANQSVGLWDGGLDDVVGLRSPQAAEDYWVGLDGTKERYRHKASVYGLRCPSSSDLAFPWDYVGPWELYPRSDKLILPYITTDHSHDLHSCYATQAKTHFFTPETAFSVNRSLSSCSPLTLVFDAICDTYIGWSLIEANPTLHVCCFPGSGCEDRTFEYPGCPDTIAGDHRRYFQNVSPAGHVNARIVLTASY